MKALLVINMPKRCDDEQCVLCYDGAMCSYLGRWMGNETERPTDCTLRPLPQEKETYVKDKAKDYWLACGWNDCLDEITGETQ